jgi:hypothetical protein
MLDPKGIAAEAKTQTQRYMCLYSQLPKGGNSPSAMGEQIRKMGCVGTLGSKKE